MQRNSTYRPGDRERVLSALRRLTDARDLLKDAACPKTLARVRAAISSCKGAVRNVGYREVRAQYTARDADHEVIVYADGSVARVED